MLKKNRNQLINFKNFSVKEPEFDTPSRKVSGYLAAFGNKDSDQDIIMKGAFLRSLADHGVDSSATQKIIFLYMHDMREPLGQFDVLKEDDTGLYFEATLDDIELSQRVLTQYESGTLNQHSIGFQYVWDKCNWEDVGDDQAFVCNELKLYEGSVVSIGANSETPFTGFKNDGNIAISQLLREELNAAMKSNNQLALRIAFEKYAKSFDDMSNIIKDLKRPSFDLDNAINNFKF